MPPNLCLIPSQLHELNNCINRAVFKIFGVSNGHTIKDIRNFVGLDDVAKIVEKRLWSSWIDLSIQVYMVIYF